MGNKQNRATNKQNKELAKSLSKQALQIEQEEARQAEIDRLVWESKADDFANSPHSKGQPDYNYVPEQYAQEPLNNPTAEMQHVLNLHDKIDAMSPEQREHIHTAIVTAKHNAGEEYTIKPSVIALKDYVTNEFHQSAMVDDGSLSPITDHIQRVVAGTYESSHTRTTAPQPNEAFEDMSFEGKVASLSQEQIDLLYNTRVASSATGPRDNPTPDERARAVESFLKVGMEESRKERAETGQDYLELAAHVKGFGGDTSGQYEEEGYQEYLDRITNSVDVSSPIGMPTESTIIRARQLSHGIPLTQANTPDRNAMLEKGMAPSPVTHYDVSGLDPSKRIAVGLDDSLLSGLPTKVTHHDPISEKTLNSMQQVELYPHSGAPAAHDITKQLAGNAANIAPPKDDPHASGANLPVGMGVESESMVDGLQFDQAYDLLAYHVNMSADDLMRDLPAAAEALKPAFANEDTYTSYEDALVDVAGLPQRTMSGAIYSEKAHEAALAAAQNEKERKDVNYNFAKSSMASITGKPYAHPKMNFGKPLTPEQQTTLAEQQEIKKTFTGLMSKYGITDAQVDDKKTGLLKKAGRLDRGYGLGTTGSGVDRGHSTGIGYTGTGLALPYKQDQPYEPAYERDELAKVVGDSATAATGASTDTTQETMFGTSELSQAQIDIEAGFTNIDLVGETSGTQFSSKAAQQEAEERQAKIEKELDEDFDSLAEAEDALEKSGEDTWNADDVYEEYIELPPEQVIANLERHIAESTERPFEFKAQKIIADNKEAAQVEADKAAGNPRGNPRFTKSGTGTKSIYAKSTTPKFKAGMGGSDGGEPLEQSDLEVAVTSKLVGMGLHVSQHEQGSAEWKAERAQMLTSTSVGSAMFDPVYGGDAPHSFTTSAKDALWNVNNPDKAERNSNPMFDKGAAGEVFAKEWYMQNKGMKITDVGMIQNPNMPGQATSVDGVITDAAGKSDGLQLFEAKWGTGNNMPADADKKHMWQMQHQMYLTGAESVDLTTGFDPFAGRAGAGNPSNFQFANKVIPRDENFERDNKEYLDDMAQLRTDFMAEKITPEQFRDAQLEAYALRYPEESDKGLTKSERAEKKTEAAIAKQEDRDAKQRDREEEKAANDKKAQLHHKRDAILNTLAAGTGGGGSMLGTGMGALAQAGPWGRAAAAAIGVGTAAYQGTRSFTEMTADTDMYAFDSTKEMKASYNALREQGMSDKQALSTNNSVMDIQNRASVGDFDGALKLVESTRGLLTMEDVLNTPPSELPILLQSKAKDAGVDRGELAGMASLAGMPQLAIDITSEEQKGDILKREKDLSAGANQEAVEKVASATNIQAIRKLDVKEKAIRTSLDSAEGLVKADEAVEENDSWVYRGAKSFNEGVTSITSPIGRFLGLIDEKGHDEMAAELYKDATAGAEGFSTSDSTRDGKKEVDVNVKVDIEDKVTRVDKKVDGKKMPQETTTRTAEKV